MAWFRATYCLRLAIRKQDLCCRSRERIGLTMYRKLVGTSGICLIDTMTSSNSNAPEIVVAGGSGFVGRELIKRLLAEFPGAAITALSRSARGDADHRVRWVACDLFSEDSIERALPENVDIVYYLVHSMGPTAQLDQGSFADYDLGMADNFAKAVSSRGVRQLIYLGGLVEDAADASLHLRSRVEMEEVFAGHGLPLTVFRAGLILGEGGSSFQILIKLVRRLPLMICPAWTQTLTAPSDLNSVVTALVTAAQRTGDIGRTYDLAGCRPLTYLEMMRETARFLGLRRYFLKVPFFTPTLSRLWVSLITGTPKNLVYPLIESLEHPMVPRPSHQFSDVWQSRDYGDLLRTVPMASSTKSPGPRFRFPRKTVRSVQRLQPGAGDAQAIAAAYFGWLGDFMKKSVVVERSGDRAIIRLLGKVDLIELEKISENSRRSVYAIRRGLLVAGGNHGRLEFRLVLGGKFALAAIHEFAPALPWFVYKYTQALVHVFVMRAFGRHLLKADT